MASGAALKRARPFPIAWRGGIALSRAVDGGGWAGVQGRGEQLGRDGRDQDFLGANRFASEDASREAVREGAARRAECRHCPSSGCTTAGVIEDRTLFIVL